MSDKAILCTECNRVATHIVGDLELCDEHYEEFVGELDVAQDLESNLD